VEKDTKARDVAYSLTSPSELKTYTAMRNCAYLEILAIFYKFEYDKDQQDELCDAELCDAAIDNLEKVLCSRVGRRT